MSSTAASGFSSLRFPRFDDPAIREALARAAARTHGRYRAEDLLAAAERGELLSLQIGPAGLVFVALLPFPQKRVANLVAAGGRLPPDAGGAFRELCEFLVRGFGVQQVELIGRRGWGRVLGLRPAGEQFVVDLERGEGP